MTPAQQQARSAAIAAAGQAVAAGLAYRDSLPPRAAAEAAWTPGGPSVDELEQMIREQRGEFGGAPEPAESERRAAA